MSAGKGSPDRHVVPRWRSVRRTIAAGEFQRRVEAVDLHPSHIDELNEIEARWRSELSAMSAAELAGASLIAGEPERAGGAAAQLVDHPNELYRLLAARVNGEQTELADSSVVSEEIDPYRVARMFYEKVAEAKLRVRRDSRNAVAWSDLARRYTALGEADKARSALSVARSLAPASRYLLRAQARFLVHLGRPDEALAALERSPRTKDDPWLMAASLSVAGTGRLPIKGIRGARRIIDRGNFRPIEVSELESELGTLELRGGADRRARALFERSLARPTDNSLAQGEWASHRLPSLEVHLDTIEVPFAAEAMTRAAAQQGEWQVALERGIEWLDDQPFDGQAATHASYIAAVGLDDWATSKLLAEMGLRANPTDPTLLNNMAYALIEMGELEAAEGWIHRVPQGVGDKSERVALDATRGLLQFRRGDIEGGRLLYGRAIERARRAAESDAEAMARSMLLREEVRFGLSELASPETIVRLRMSVRDAGVLRCIQRALRLAELSGHPVTGT